MANYRYSSSGIDSLIRKSFVLTSILLVIAIFAGWTLTAINSGLHQSLQLLPFFALAAVAIVFWVRHKSTKSMMELARTTEVELTEDSLTGRNGQIQTVILRTEVSEVKYLRDGILVRGRNLAHSLHLKPELDGFAELAAELDSWVPSEVTRTRSGGMLQHLILALVIGNIVLFGVAFSITTPTIGVPLCLLEAFVLAACIVWSWRNPATPKQLKRQLLIGGLPILALLGRAYTLATQP